MGVTTRNYTRLVGADVCSEPLVIEEGEVPADLLARLRESPQIPPTPGSSGPAWSWRWMSYSRCWGGWLTSQRLAERQEPSVWSLGEVREVGPRLRFDACEMCRFRAGLCARMRHSEGRKALSMRRF